MANLALTVVTPQKLALDTRAQWVDIPAASGLMRALPEHAPTLGTLGQGTLRYQAESGEEKDVVIAGGFFEVLGDRVTVLADAES